MTLRLIRQAQQGDGGSQRQVADLARHKVYVYLLRLTLDHHLAEDLCQDTLLEMVRFLPQLNFDRVAAFWGWLYRTALSKVQQQGRKQRQRDRRMHINLMESEWLAQHAIDDRPYGLDRAQEAELLQAVLAAMTELKVSYRNILALRCFDQLSYAEIAAISGSTQLRAKQLFFRAKQSLKRQLKRQGYASTCLSAALGLFGTATLGGKGKAVSLVTVSEASLEAAPLAAALQVLSAKALPLVVSLGLVAGGVLGGKSLWQRSAPFRWPQDPLVHLIDSNDFAYPVGIVQAQGPWYATTVPEPSDRRDPVDPNELLVGPRPADGRTVLLPSSCSMELVFDGPLRDGPGPDCFFLGWGCRAIEVGLTDGQGRTFPLPVRSCTVHPAGFGVVAYDLQELGVLPFVPRALSLRGMQPLNSRAAYRLGQVRARID